MAVQLTSDSTAPSSPGLRLSLNFSSDAIEHATPPSSPPGFPWERGHQQLQTSPIRNKPNSIQTRRIHNAFSILGKRKPLAETTGNDRAHKRRQADLSAKYKLDRASSSSPSVSSSAAPSQLQLSLGQKTQLRCKSCGMEYVPSSPEDQQLHAKFHKQHAEGYDIGRDFVSATAQTRNVFRIPSPSASKDSKDDADHVVAVDVHDKSHRKRRAQAVLEIVQRELGAVEIPAAEIWDNTRGGRASHDVAGVQPPKFCSYLYIRESKCVGFLLIERVTASYAVARPPPRHHDASKPENLEPPAVHRRSIAKATSALAALRARKAAQQSEFAAADDMPTVLLSPNVTLGERLGISRIWTSPTHRSQGIASILLDTALAHRGSKLEGKRKEELVAFSPPTQAGARLARKWIGRAFGWYVYVD